MSKATEAEKKEASDELRKILKPGDTVFSVLRHVSKSGMSRLIDFYAVRDNEHVFLTGYIASALGYKRPRNADGIRVSGGGMDMGFHVVYSLGYAMWPTGFTCVGKECRSNDHSNGDRDRKPHNHRDGGYALRHKWL